MMMRRRRSFSPRRARPTYAWANVGFSSGSFTLQNNSVNDLLILPEATIKSIGERPTLVRIVGILSVAQLGTLLGDRASALFRIHSWPTAAAGTRPSPTTDIDRRYWFYDNREFTPLTNNDAAWIKVDVKPMWRAELDHEVYLRADNFGVPATADLAVSWGLRFLFRLP